MSKEIWQEAASPSCQPSRRRMHLSAAWRWAGTFARGGRYALMSRYVRMGRLRQKCPFSLGIWTPSSTWFLGPTRINPPLRPNGISIGSAIFAQLTRVPNIQTDRQTDRRTADYATCEICSKMPNNTVTMLGVD